MANPKGTPENLRPKKWKKGQSGNPRGPKKGTIRVTDHLRRLVEEGDQSDEPLGVRMARIAVDKALEGDYKFFKDVVDRLDGTAMQRVQAVVASQEAPELAYCTDEELTTLREIMERAKARMEAEGGGADQ